MDLISRFEESLNSFNRASGLVDRGQLDEAQELLERALALYPREVLLDSEVDVPDEIKNSYDTLFGNIRDKLETIQALKSPKLGAPMVLNLRELVERNLARRAMENPEAYSLPPEIKEQQYTPPEFPEPEEVIYSMKDVEIEPDILPEIESVVPAAELIDEKPEDEQFIEQSAEQSVEQIAEQPAEQSDEPVYLPDISEIEGQKDKFVDNIHSEFDEAVETAAAKSAFQVVSAPEPELAADRSVADAINASDALLEDAIGAALETEPMPEPEAKEAEPAVDEPSLEETLRSVENLADHIAESLNKPPTEAELAASAHDAAVAAAMDAVAKATSDEAEAPVFAEEQQHPAAAEEPHEEIYVPETGAEQTLEQPEEILNEQPVQADEPPVESVAEQFAEQPLEPAAELPVEPESVLVEEYLPEQTQATTEEPPAETQAGQTPAQTPDVESEQQEEPTQEMKEEKTKKKSNPFASVKSIFGRFSKKKEKTVEEPASDTDDQPGEIFTEPESGISAERSAETAPVAEEIAEQPAEQPEVDLHEEVYVPEADDAPVVAEQPAAAAEDDDEEEALLDEDEMKRLKEKAKKPVITMEAKVDLTGVFGSIIIVIMFVVGAFLMYQNYTKSMAAEKLFRGGAVAALKGGFDESLSMSQDYASLLGPEAASPAKMSYVVAGWASGLGNEKQVDAVKLLEICEKQGMTSSVLTEEALEAVSRQIDENQSAGKHDAVESLFVKGVELIGGSALPESVNRRYLNLLLQGPGVSVLLTPESKMYRKAVVAMVGVKSLLNDSRQARLRKMIAVESVALVKQSQAALKSGDSAQAVSLAKIALQMEPDSKDAAAALSAAAASAAATPAKPAAKSADKPVKPAKPVKK